MPLVVGVTFRRVGKVYYFDPGELALHEGDFVIAETARGIEFGEVVLDPRQVAEETLVAALKRIVRVATSDDLNREASNRDREKSAIEVCERKIAEHKLPMKLLDAECSFDGSMITFSFSAEGRIDFRELVKDIANTLRVRVQLHQIGVRDEAKLIGGYGGCGRPLCCATFLSSFEPVSMKMAKDQSLFLNPAKFSGCCGKLMCCLRYEHEFYMYAHDRLPAVGAILNIEQGRARVVDVNVVANSLTVETQEGVEIHIPATEVLLEGLCRRHGVACTMSDKGCEPMLAGDKPHCPKCKPDEKKDEAPEDIFDKIVERPKPVADKPRREDRSEPVHVHFRPLGQGEEQTPQPVDQNPTKPKQQEHHKPRGLHPQGGKKPRPGHNKPAHKQKHTGHEPKAE